MNFSLLSVLIFVVAASYKSHYSQVSAIPLDKNAAQSDDREFVNEYASIRHAVIYDLGYTEEFADMVEINLKRAIKEEKERQKQQGIAPIKLRQGMQGLPTIQPSHEDYEDEDTATGSTTPGPSGGDVLRGVAGILAGLGTLNVGNFWQSFVNFFPPSRREGAQAVVDASLGRRPAKWPTMPTTTTKLTTTTSSNEDSDETTKKVVTSAPVVASATPAAGAATAKPAASIVTSAPAVSAGATPKPTTLYSAPVTETVMKVPTTKYKLLIRRRTSSATVSPDDDEAIGLRGIDENVTPSSLPETTQSATTASLSS